MREGKSWMNGNSTNDTSSPRASPFMLPAASAESWRSVLGADLSRLSPEDRFWEELRPFFEYDGLADVEIVIELEKEFDIKLSDEDTKEVKSVRDAVETVWEKVRQKPA